MADSRAKWAALEDENEDGLDCADTQSAEERMEDEEVEEGGGAVSEPDALADAPTEKTECPVHQELLAMQAAMGGRLEILQV